jgi:hypothetical protein
MAFSSFQKLQYKERKELFEKQNYKLNIAYYFASLNKLHSLLHRKMAFVWPIIDHLTMINKGSLAHNTGNF